MVLVTPVLFLQQVKMSAVKRAYDHNSPLLDCQQTCESDVHAYFLPIVISDVNRNTTKFKLPR